MKRIFNLIRSLDWRPMAALAIVSLILCEIIYFGLVIGTSIFLTL